MSHEYLPSWKASRGFYENRPDGFRWLSDEECDWWLDQERAHVASLRSAMPRTDVGWKKLFGLFVPHVSSRLEADEVRGRVDMEDLVKRYAEDVRVFGDRVQSRCPFHADRSPSFSASIDKKVWYCFGCGEKGDCFSLVMRLDAVPFVDALKSLNETYR